MRLGGALIAGLAIGLVVGERLRPLRASVEPRTPHDLRNLLIGALSAAVVAALQTPLVEPLARETERRRWGLMQKGRAPAWLRTAGAVLLMDYTLYLWHVLTHRAPWLWRLHAPHHADRDLTATTALRFHFLEMAASVPYRALQVRLLGVTPGALRLWQSLTLAAILFHHSNLRLPTRLERVIGWVLATPRMHGIHHSVVRSERDSNWSSGLSIWDRLHGTLRLEPAQEELIVGIPDAGRRLGFGRALALPFTAEARR